MATQGYLIPVVAIPRINWAAWPSLPDIFGMGLIMSVVLTRAGRLPISSLDRATLRDLIWMAAFFVTNFLLVTIPNSTTGEGIKFGGYTLILFAKLLIVFWAVIRIPLDERRLHILHLAALTAFLWLALTSLADKFSIIDIEYFTRHLPTGLSGKWGVVNLDSTASATHGGSTVTLLVIGALVVGTARRRFAWLVDVIVFVLSLGMSFVAGSRQGLVRVAAFIVLYLYRKPGRIMLLLWLAALVLPVLTVIVPTKDLETNTYLLRSIERQSVLLDDPFSNEGLSGRPALWVRVIETLNEAPVRWLVGYGLGNYAEFKSAAHNQFLRFLQDGGLIQLICFSILWARIFRRAWMMRSRSWAMTALTGAMFTSVLTSSVFYPTLATGWYLGLYFVVFHILGEIRAQSRKPTPSRHPDSVLPWRASAPCVTSWKGGKRDIAPIRSAPSHDHQRSGDHA